MESAAILLTVGLCATGIRQAMALCFSCVTTPCGSGSVVLSAISSTIQATDGEFSGTDFFCFAWAYPSGQPDFVVIEFDDGASNNIASVEYGPSLITDTTCCQGAVDVDIVSGTLVEDDQNGTLETVGWAFTPYREDTHTLTVNH